MHVEQDEPTVNQASHDGCQRMAKLTRPGDALGLTVRIGDVPVAVAAEGLGTFSVPFPNSATLALRTISAIRSTEIPWEERPGRP